ncbi:ATP-dependent endonuclease [Tenacibaculum singaporense]|uniref:AAA+ ATPase domain-containing protein n=1 Tax=Tenacibaculum singaporense TaxID=2358479 RepID=A0A3S8R923_9FLAO|nr:AAA family ATPase [Tenacibaculum singaporense]AZJ36309.1 hypothetical protein D6T69_12520 [Tenacibaculum singaporense]
MIHKINLKKFKRYKSNEINLKPNSVTILAGGNNSGKSTLLHAIAVWEFCKLILTIEKGRNYLHEEHKGQGLGVSADEFLPIALPSLKHLWTNLKTQKEGVDEDGYNLRIKCFWFNKSEQEKYLEIALSLANDRLFIKTTESNIIKDDKIPTAAYLPTFAGILERENKVSLAERRKLIGKGLAGSVLRNLLLDLYQKNQIDRSTLKGTRAKIKTSDLHKFRLNDPFERLINNIRNTFSTDLRISDFNDLYHTYIKVDCFKGEFNEKKRFKKFNSYNYRDLMVEGSGFLQWLNVFTLTLSPDIDIVLLDEPDAHLHPSLQIKLIDELEKINTRSKKQILIATHSSEIIKEAIPNDILNLNNTKYLTTESQKTGLLSGLGSEYSPLLHKIKTSKKVLFVEGHFDFLVLKKVGELINQPIDESVVPWISVSSHKQRKFLFSELKSQIPNLRSVSIRDRDDESLNTVGEDLKDLTFTENQRDDMKLYKWKRRNIENYLFLTPIISELANIDETVVSEYLSNEFAISIPCSYKDSKAPEIILRLNGKGILDEDSNSIKKKFNVSKFNIVENLKADSICDDLITMVQNINKDLN